MWRPDKQAVVAVCRTAVTECRAFDSRCDNKDWGIL